MIMWVPLKLSLIYFVSFMALLLVTTCLSTLITRYNDWQEIARGNAAAAVVLGGKLLGVAIIVRTAILTNPSLLYALLWGLIGTVLLLATYLLFELLTVRLNVNTEIARGNVAVAVLCAALSLAVSLIVSASIA